MASIKMIERATGVSWLVKWADRPFHMSEKRFPTKREAEAFVAALPPRAPAKKRAANTAARAAG